MMCSFPKLSSSRGNSWWYKIFLTNYSMEAGAPGL
jgi:hypothetical protein